MAEKRIPCQIFSRVVGYYAAVQDWNKGKKQEWKEREVYRVPGRAELARREKPAA
jgi:anaerobic ribonucleoside-triphosphate reductase